MRLTRGEFLGALLAPVVAWLAPFLPKRDWTVELDKLNLVTLSVLGNRGLADNFFQTTPLLMRYRELESMAFHGGGTSLREPFDYETYDIHCPSSQEVAWLT